jgi:hypothetical protein
MNKIQIFIRIFSPIPSAGQENGILKRLKIHFVNLLKTFFQPVQLSEKDRKCTKFPSLAQKMIIFAN